MEVTDKMKTVEYKLPEKIDLENVNLFREQINQLDIADDTELVIFDGSDLSYISSFGLRLFLHMVKNHNSKVLIDNVSDEIYEIFAMTGFTKIVKVRKALNYVDVSNLEVIGRGAFGSVYKLNDEQVLKVFEGENSRERLDAIVDNTRTAFVNGIPTIIPFETVITDRGLGLVSEYIYSDVLSVKAHSEPERIPEYAGLMADMSKKLVLTKLEGDSLRCYKDKIASDIADIKDMMTEDDYDLLQGYLKLIPDTDSCIHGDFHARNVMMMDDEVVLIDMDDFGRGHPVWDISGLILPYKICVDRPDLVKLTFDLPDELPYDDFFFSLYNLTKEEATVFFNEYIDRYFHGISEERKQNCMKLAWCYADCLVTRIISLNIRGRELSPEILARKKIVIDCFLDELRKYSKDEIREFFASWPTHGEM